MWKVTTQIGHGWLARPGETHYFQKASRLRRWWTNFWYGWKWEWIQTRRITRKGK